MIKLHLGCGNHYLTGWVNIDSNRNVKADRYKNIEDLDYPDGSVDLIFMTAVFEHFPRHIAIVQLRKFYKWLIPRGLLQILVPDFFATVEKLKLSQSVEEQLFWFRHLYGPQDTIEFGTHYDGFTVKKLSLMFSIVGFNRCEYRKIAQFPNIQFTGIKDGQAGMLHAYKSDEDVERDIIKYMTFYENRIENGDLFKAWMKAMGLKAKKPQTPDFETQRV